MLKMRLQRIGRRNDPAFRVIVADSRQGPKSGKQIDSIGSYNPKTGEIQIDGEKAKQWIGNGVQVSDTVHNMLVEQKIIEGAKINALPKKSPIVSETAEAEKVSPAPATETETNEAPEEGDDETAGATENASEGEESPTEEEAKSDTPAPEPEVKEDDQAPEETSSSAEAAEDKKEEAVTENVEETSSEEKPATEEQATEEKK